MIPIDTREYSMLEIFAESDSGRNGTIKLKGPQDTVLAEPAGDGYYRLIRLPVERNTQYHLELCDCHYSIGYLSGNDNIMEDGVCFLEDGKQIGREELKEIYDTPYREQYHFNPIKNWINDPNGFCWFEGRYHLFYQANPHEQRWDDMYWGHTVSKDLVHWVHLPYVLEPQANLMGNAERKGGAFSGCAVPLEDRVVFYLTRHDGPQEDGADTIEWQTMTESRNMLDFEPETEIIRQKPQGAGHDFRDPKVIWTDGHWYMVLGSNLNQISSILLYRSDDMKNWEYVGPLLMEEDRGSTTIECPDFYQLDGAYVAVGALMKHIDDCGRHQMTRCYIGDFKDEKLEVKSTQWYDFGSNFYAAQSLEHEGRRIVIGWISDFYGEHVAAPGGAYGSMSLPRELHVQDGRLTMRPVEEVYSLLGNKLYGGSGMVGLPKIKGNSFYVKAQFEGNTDFAFLLGENKETSIWLKRENQTIRIQTIGTASSHGEFKVEIAKVRTVEIFVDRRTVEVYINEGEAAGTKIFYSGESDGVFVTKIEDIQKLKQIEVYEMNSIWN